MHELLWAGNFSSVRSHHVQKVNYCPYVSLLHTSWGSFRMFQAIIGNKSHPSQEIAPWLRYGCGLPRTRPLGVKLLLCWKSWNILTGLFEFWTAQAGIGSRAAPPELTQNKLVLKLFGVTMLETCFRCPVVLAEVCFYAIHRQVPCFYADLQFLAHFDHFIDVTRFQMFSAFYEELIPNWSMGQRKGVSECRHEGCLHAHTKQLIPGFCGLGSKQRGLQESAQLSWGMIQSFWVAEHDKTGALSSMHCDEESWVLTNVDQHIFSVHSCYSSCWWMILGIHYS